MNKWFGAEPFSPACLSTPRVSTPLACCTWCDEPFTEDDIGYVIPHISETVTELAWHADCWLRQIIGSLAHIEDRCSCVGGGEETDPPELTKREAARAAVEAFRRRGER